MYYLLFTIVYESCAAAYSELKSNELFAFAMMDTRKGQPQETGIMPSLLVLDYHVTTNKVENNKCMLQFVSCNMSVYC